MTFPKSSEHHQTR